MAEETAKTDLSTVASAKAEVPEKFKALVDSIDKLSALELSELVKVLEDRFGVSASAPMMMGSVPAAGAGAAAGQNRRNPQLCG